MSLNQIQTQPAIDIPPPLSSSCNVNHSNVHDPCYSYDCMTYNVVSHDFDPNSYMPTPTSFSLDDSFNSLLSRFDNFQKQCAEECDKINESHQRIIDKMSRIKKSREKSELLQSCLDDESDFEVSQHCGNSF